MTLTISLPVDTEMKLRQRAAAAGQDMAQFVQQLLTMEIAAPLTVSHTKDPILTLDDEYERGYARFPEDPSLPQSLIPHLTVDLENWE